MKLVNHLIMNNRCYKIPRCSVSFEPDAYISTNPCFDFANGSIEYSNF